MSSSQASPKLPTPPFIEVEGLPNCRDIGGYAVQGQPGKVVKRNVVFRASEPSQLTDAGIATLQSLGITHVYDLRSATEIERSVKHQDRRIREWDGAKRVFAPVFLDEDHSPAAIAIRYKDFAAEGPEVCLMLHPPLSPTSALPKVSGLLAWWRKPPS